MRFEEPKFEQKEAEEIVKFKNFLIENLPAISPEALSKKKAGELFELYKNLINEEASFENFKKFLLTCASETEKEIIQELAKDDVKNDILISDAYRKYLLMKLPKELQERQEQISEERNEPEIPIERLERVHERRGDDRMVLGFHTSPINFWREPVTKVERAFSRDEFAVPETGKKYCDESAKTWYSADRRQLYFGQTQPKYVYLIEATNSEFRTKQHYDREHGAFYSHSPLTALCMLPLTPETMKIFDLKFGRGL